LNSPQRLRNWIYQKRRKRNSRMKLSQQVSLKKLRKTNLRKRLNKMKIIGIEEASEALLSPAII
jgi:hypothetical protein